MLAWHSAGAAPVSSPCDSGECATSVTSRSAQRCSSPPRSGARSSRLYFTCARAARPDVRAAKRHFTAPASARPHASVEASLHVEHFQLVYYR